MRSQCAVKGNLASGTGASPVLWLTLWVLEADTVQAIPTSVATAEALRGVTEYGLEAELPASPGGLGHPGWRGGDLREAPLSRIWGHPAPPFPPPSAPELRRGG